MMSSGQDVAEPSVQIRSMGLKVHYTFDKESKINCLARSPHPVQVQTVAIDESTSIGVIDLRICIRAVTECSPELAGQDGDYTIYALDYSEPDHPLVGQGMLSWALENSDPSEEPKMITGRVTKNVLAVFGNGSRETLEVKLRLSSGARVQRPGATRNETAPYTANPASEGVSTPTGVSEWNSFMQMNPQLSQQHQPHHQHQHQHQPQLQRMASPSQSNRLSAPNLADRRDSFSMSSIPIMQVQPKPQEMHRVAPTPVYEHLPPVAIPPAPSRPSSRTSNKSSRSTKPRKAPTGRPRGRPRKKTAEGNTSGYEDGTEGEDAGPPTKKRATITQVESAKSSTTNNSFIAGMESSLRVTASNSSSLRTFRPVGASSLGASGGHLQEIPRAPTPVPKARLGDNGKRPNRMSVLGRRESTMSQEFIPSGSQYSDAQPYFAPSCDDGRSPDSNAPTPAFSEDSQGVDMRSSPPVPRMAQFMRSSPPPSSPILPPMPMPQPHAAFLHQSESFLNDDMDLFGDDSAPPLAGDLYIADGSYQEQVFHLHPGPESQELSRPGLIPTPLPTSTPALPVDDPMEVSLPALKDSAKMKAAPRRARGKKRSPDVEVPANKQQPTTALTPPLTTDALEKAVSPEDGQGEKRGRDAQSEIIPPPEPTLPEPKQSKASAEPEQEPEAKADILPTARQVLPKTASEPPTPPTLEYREAGIAAAGATKRRAQLSRSQSTGVLPLPTVPASEPAGPSALSTVIQVEDGEEDRTVVQIDALRRAITSNSLVLPLPGPASEPAGPLNEVDSDATIVPTSPQTSRSNKNMVKKQAIKQRLEEAILNGEMPPFCTNCGAIETPTWRKTFVQDHDGAPGEMELSAEPGKITAVEVTSREEDGVPTAYRIIKKSLAPDDVKQEWQEMLVCNPCGIWLVKSKSHRPSSRWDKDADRLGQERRRRGGGSRKRARTKKDAIVEPTSEMYLPTDVVEAIECMSPPKDQSQMDGAASQSQSARTTTTQTAGQGTFKSPARVDEGGQPLGATKRLLFPSPRKDGEMKILGDISVNIVHTPSKRVRLSLSDQDKDECSGINKTDKLAVSSISPSTSIQALEALLQTPKRDRASTPPPRSTPREMFKTPTRPTPSHRPVTRSVTRSRRSDRSLVSPRQPDLPQQQTPSRTPSLVRRSPRHHVGSGFGGGTLPFGTPLSRQISQLIDDNPHFGVNDWSDALDGADEMRSLGGAAVLTAGDSHADFSDLPELNPEQFWSDMGDWQGSWE